MLAMIRKKLKAQKKSKLQKETAMGGVTRKGSSLFGHAKENSIDLSCLSDPALTESLIPPKPSQNNKTIESTNDGIKV